MIPTSVAKTLNTLFESFKKHDLPCISIYLYGSIALNNYIEGSSDIDFIAVLPQVLTVTEIEAIRKSHLELETLLPQTDIMGSYVLQTDLGKSIDQIKYRLTYTNKQLFINEGQSDINPITWWILKHDGIHVYGPKLELEYEYDIDRLLAYVHSNINTYWAGWVSRLKIISIVRHFMSSRTVSKYLDSAIEWSVLGMLRQLYTIRELSIKSKVDAGYYGLQVVPKQWHNLIEEAISIKKLEPKRLYTSNRARCKDLVALLTYIRSEVNRHYGKSLD